jgi:hypothetical protein
MDKLKNMAKMNWEKRKCIVNFKVLTATILLSLTAKNSDIDLSDGASTIAV